MATITNLTGGTGIPSSFGLGVNGSLTVSVGDWLVVIVACPNSGAGGAAPTITIADSDGLNTYTQRVVTNYDPAGANEGATLAFFTCEVSDAVTSGDLLVSFGNSTPQRTCQVYRVRPATNEVITFSSVGAGNTGGGVSSYSAPAVSVSSGNIIFGAAAVETDDAATGDSDTTNGSWSALVQLTADGGPDDDSMINLSQYKQVTATGSQTWTATTVSTNAYAANYLVLDVDKVLTVSPGSHAVTGTAVSLERGRLLTVAAGSYTVTGTDVAFVTTGNKLIGIEVGSYAVTGTDVSTLHGFEVAADAGQYDVTGTAVGVLHGWEIVPEAGSYAVTGDDVSLEHGLFITIDAGSHTVTGTDQTFIKSGTFALLIEAGSHSYSGSAVSVLHGWEIVPEAGSYAVSGADVTLRHGWAWFLDTPGSYSHSGSEVTFTKTASSPIQVRGILRTAPFTHTLRTRFNRR